MARTPDHGRRRDMARRALKWLAGSRSERITMCSLARALGMKRPTLYWYYRDLGELFDAILEDLLEQQTAFFAERLAAVHHPLDRLRAYMRATIAFGAPRRREILALFELWAVSRSEDADRILERARAYLEPIREGLIALVRTGIEQGLIAATDPEALIDAVLTFCDGLAVERITRDPDPYPALEAFERGLLEPLRLGDTATSPCTERARIKDGRVAGSTSCTRA